MGTNLGNIKITEHFISLEKIIASKNKHLLHIIPKSLMQKFKNLIHLDRINEIIYKYRDKHGADFADAVLDELKITRTIINEENIPLDNRPLVVANHPFGSIDGMTLISIMSKCKGGVLFPVNDILCQLPGLKGVFVPINKYGRNATNHNALNSAFSGEGAVCFFPAGTESKIIDGKLQDFAWKKSFVKKAQQFSRDIIPVYIDGGNSNSFYRLYKIRRFFGIKFDLEMILLPREMFKNEGTNIRLTFGKTIPIETIDNRYTTQEWAQKIRNYVYELKDNKSAVFKA